LLLVFAFHAAYTQKPTSVKPNKEYSDAITRADKLMLDEDYMKALNEYERAWNLYQRQKYPEKKIDQITKLLANPIQNRPLFEKAIRGGDSCFSVNDYKNANVEYYNALRLDPSAQYPKERLNEISKLFADPENETRYRITLIHAGKALNRASYDKAISFYQQALLMKPSEQWLNQKISETLVLKEKSAAGMDPYTRLITEADNLMDQAKWAEARTGFEKALEIKPKENYPAARIVLIDHLLHFSHTGERTYENLIVDADAFYRLKDYNNAGIHYEVALSLKPGEQYPKSMLKKIDHTKLQVNASTEDYDAAVANADILSSAGDIEAALIAFKKCEAIVPGDNYVKSRITELSKYSEANTSNRDAYLLAVAKGDKSLMALNYTKALSEYRYASWLMPDETYPKLKIEEIQSIVQKEKSGKKSIQSISNPTDELAVKKEIPTTPHDTLPAKNSLPVAKQSFPETAELAVAPAEPRDKEKDSKGLIPAVELAEESNNYTADMRNSNGINTVNPNELYSRGKSDAVGSTQEKQITEVPGNKLPVTALPEKAEAKQTARASEVSKPKPQAVPSQKPAVASSPASKPAMSKPNADQEKYDQAIEFADKARDEQNYAHAINGYKAALKLKPAENYPQEQLNSISLIQKQENTSQANYKTVLLSADKAFENKDYQKALSEFQKASELNPDQKYPQEKIASIKIITGQQKALQNNYNKAIAAADQAFNANSYQEAISGYKSALKLKPAETYPKEKIEAINSLLGLTAEKQDNYRKLITEADRIFNEKQYDEALLQYMAASQIKPGEPYPKQKIAAINVKLGQQKARQDKYDNAIHSADLAYTNKDFVTAITDYKTALTLSPDQSYPKEQNEIINTFLSQQKTINESYTKAIMAGEKALVAKDYLPAIDGFQSALEFKPDEKYPREKITEINGILSLNKEKLDQQYNDYISQADALFDKQDFLTAQKAYKMALALKPGEDYPLERNNQIADIVAAQARAVKEAYELAIADGDKAYKSLLLDQAVTCYSKALDIKPGEVYPGQMIARIRKYMIDNSVVEVNTASFILKKDFEKRLLFKPVDINLRKNNYLLVRTRISGDSNPKLYINYGSGNLKNGGVVLKNINSKLFTDFVINISIQDKWFREDNNWLSLYSENGDLEVTSIYISQGKQIMAPVTQKRTSPTF
jgi:tetratricopeptide (TPR) repeat protein